MQVFDVCWTKLVEGAGLTIALYRRYMDYGGNSSSLSRRGEGGRVLSCPILGDERDRSPTQMTIMVLRETLVGIEGYLRFTIDSGEDYGDNWLPTLDTSLRINEDNVVEYEYFEKPTTTNTTIRWGSAMSENSKVQCLSNDLVRRLLKNK